VAEPGDHVELDVHRRVELEQQLGNALVAGNLAVASYAAAMVHGMLGDPDARARWTDS
jgi:hypothetical protein